MTVVAITGGTGFVGSRTIDAAIARGMAVRALTRRSQPARAGITWVEGALDQPDSLTQLCEGANAVLHIAGVVNAPDRAGFAAGNVTGTANVAAAAQAAGVPRFIHVSSLAAKEPGLSDYGWSKAGAEAEVRESGLDWTMVRPPAIFGPGDTEMLDLFRMAQRGTVLLPPRGYLSVIHVDDLAQLLVTLTSTDRDSGAIMEVDDGRPNGWSHAEFAHALGAAVGRKVLPIYAPAPLLHLAAKTDRLLRGRKAKLTPDRASYMAHPDWRIDPAQRPPSQLWHPAIDTATGLAETVQWYRDKGWLKQS